MPKISPPNKGNHKHTQNTNSPLTAAVGPNNAHPRLHIQPKVESLEQQGQVGPIPKVDVAHFKNRRRQMHHLGKLKRHFVLARPLDELHLALVGLCASRCHGGCFCLFAAGSRLALLGLLFYGFFLGVLLGDALGLEFSQALFLLFPRLLLGLVLLRLELL